MNRKLKCFVACAFGKPDVDSMFKTSIVPILKALQIEVLRVDLINHNKNIDLKIIELIRNCDFGIADLTYARPSVYYEAGFIHGLGKEVVFTVRDDHFKHDNNDTEGNRRIHFDLANKNIIGWKENKTQFGARLKSRINLITRPILAEKRLAQVVEKDEHEFDRLSIVSKIEMINQESKDLIKRHKYKIANENVGFVSGWKKDRNKKKVIMALTFDSLTFKKLSRFNDDIWLIGDVPGAHLTDQSALTIIFNILRPLSVSTAQRALRNFQMLPDRKGYTQHEAFTGRLINYFILDNIRSVSDYKSKQKIFEKL